MGKASQSLSPSDSFGQAIVHTPVDVSSVEQLPDNSGTVVGVLELTLDGNTHTGSHGEVRDHGHLGVEMHCIVSGVQIWGRSLRIKLTPKIVAVIKWKRRSFRSTRLAMTRTTKKETAKMAKKTQRAVFPLWVAWMK